MWTELLKFFGGSVLLLAAVAWLIRSLIRHFLSKDVEKYKFDLRREADKELAAIKASLNIDALTHQIRFSKLHERRAEIVEQLYKKIVALETASACLEVECQFDDYKKLKETADTLIDKYFEIHLFIENNKIYFSEDLSDAIKDFNSLYFDLSIGIRYQSKPDNKEEFIKAFQKERDKVGSQNKRLKMIIETDFRKLLGVTA